MFNKPPTINDAWSNNDYSIKDKEKIPDNIEKNKEEFSKFINFLNI